jgi:hypothetical protein
VQWRCAAPVAVLPPCARLDGGLHCNSAWQASHGGRCAAEREVAEVDQGPQLVLEHACMVR